MHVRTTSAIALPAIKVNPLIYHVYNFILSIYNMYNEDNTPNKTKQI